jgi:queuine tRNA-ribosyltransferase
VADEMLGGMIGSIHNLHFYLDLVKTARKKIEEGVFSTWKNEVMPKISTRL